MDSQGKNYSNHYVWPFLYEQVTIWQARFRAWRRWQLRTETKLRVRWESHQAQSQWVVPTELGIQIKITTLMRGSQLKLLWALMEWGPCRDNPWAPPPRLLGWGAKASRIKCSTPDLVALLDCSTIMARKEVRMSTSWLLLNLDRFQTQINEGFRMWLLKTREPLEAECLKATELRPSSDIWIRVKTQERTMSIYCSSNSNIWTTWTEASMSKITTMLSLEKLR